MSSLLFVQLIFKCSELCGLATWMPDLLLLVVHTTSIFKLAECEVLRSIPYLDNYEVMDSNPERDKLAEYKVLGSNHDLNNYEFICSNPEFDKIVVISSNPKFDKIVVMDSNL